MLTKEIHQRIRSCGVIAVVVIDDAALAVPLARALLKGGIDGVELTLRTPAGIEAIRRIRQEVPEMLVGAGTVLTTAQVDEALKAGAQFGVAPGLNERVVSRAIEVGLPFGPGIMTPSEIERSVELGCRTLKFFPAESVGGIKTLKTMAAPYQHLGLDFIPLGGLNEANMGSYLASPLVAAIGGSWIAPREAIAKQDWATIEGLAKAASKVASESRK